MAAGLKMIWLFCFLLFGSNEVFAQASIRAVVMPDVVTKDEFFAYSIIIEDPGEVKSFTPPDLRDFVIVNGPVQGSRNRVINGQTRHYLTYDYILRPKKLGNFTIGIAMARVGGDYVSSNSTNITVLRRTARNAKDAGLTRWEYKDFILDNADSFQKKVEDNMQFRLEVSKKECFVGEPLTAAYKLYSRAKNELQDRQNFSFNGFSIIEMMASDLLSQPTDILNGKSYNVNVLRRVQLYPLRAGTVVLEPSTLQTTVHFVNGNYAAKAPDMDMLYDEFVNSVLPPDAEIVREVNLLSRPVSIAVKPLPEINRPAGFDGAVGRFSINASLADSVLSVAEPGQLTLTVSGNGNLQLLTMPAVTWPPELEVFEPKVKETLSTSTIPVSGMKKFTYPFHVKKAGKFTIAPVSFSFFDPEEGRYHTVTTSPLTIQVNAGSNPILASNNINQPTPDKFSATEIFRHRQWIVIFVGILMFTVLFFALLKDKPTKKPVTTNNIQSASEAGPLNLPNHILAKAEGCLDNEDCAIFYEALNSDLRGYLAQKFKLEVSSIHSHSISAVLDKHAIPNDLVLQLENLLQQIEWKLYAPFQRDNEMRELYANAFDMINQLQQLTTKPQ